MWKNLEILTKNTFLRKKCKKSSNFDQKWPKMTKNLEKVSFFSKKSSLFDQIGPKNHEKRRKSVIFFKKILNFRPIVAIYDRFLNKIRFTVRNLTFLTIYAPFLNQTLNCPYWRLWALRKRYREWKGEFWDQFWAKSGRTTHPKKKIRFFFF